VRLTSLLPEEFQEEVLGDLQEKRCQLLVEGCPAWLVNLRMVLWSLDLVLSCWYLKSK
jgi:hypothetical protein